VDRRLNRNCPRHRSRSVAAPRRRAWIHSCTVRTSSSEDVGADLRTSGHGSHTRVWCGGERWFLH
jgi:hypothetical protein